MAEDEHRDVRLNDPEADRLMVETEVVWAYLPHLLRYPLRGYALNIVVMMGAWIWLCGFAGVFGIPAASILFGWMGHYFMGVVAQTASGHAIPPPLGTEVLFQGDKLRLGFLVGYITAVLSFTVTLSHGGHTNLALLLFALGVFLLPAFIACLALEPTAIHTLNPLTLLTFVMHTGLPYVIACLLMAAIGFLAVVFAGHVSGIFTGMLTIYLLMFACHLVGFIAYHHHEDLNLAVSVAKPTEESRAMEAQAKRIKALLAKVDACLQAKDPRGARDALLAENAAGLANPRLYNEDLFEALRARHEDALSLVQGVRLIQALMREKRTARALDICEQCLDLSAQFAPEPQELVLPMAEEAVRTSRLKLFDKLSAAVVARWPDSDAAAAVQFLKARQLAEQKQDEAARSLLEPLLAKTSHPWKARIAALHAALASLQKKA
ncbi:MAG TPA: hypothetical protein VLG68_00910 [Gammaproteobacteria bacterium]|nr:hypothetical protein [Gammaproteobacteria bacterium]